MRLSLAYEMQRPVVDDHAVIQETLEQCVLADRMGFDTIWFVEHHFLPSFSVVACSEINLPAINYQINTICHVLAVITPPFIHSVRRSTPHVTVGTYMLLLMYSM